MALIRHQRRFINIYKNNKTPLPHTRKAGLFMNTIERIKTRRSIRKFTDTPVSRDTMSDIISAASYAPSWKNSQTVRYIVIESEEILNKIANTATLGFEHNKGIISGCKTLVAAITIGGKCGYNSDGTFTTSKKDKWEAFDAGIAVQTFCLAASELGVGSVILGIFDEDIMRDILNLPEGQYTAALIATGYPDIEPTAPVRKSVEELVTFI